MTKSDIEIIEEALKLLDGSTSSNILKRLANADIEGALEVVQRIKDGVPEDLKEAVSCYPICNDEWLKNTLKNTEKRGEDTGKIVVKAAAHLLKITGGSDD